MEPINTALCSFGMSGWVFHAPFININPGFNLYAVWERSKNLAEKKYPNIKTFRTLEDMLANNAVELVVVNTPNYTHYDYTKKALEAGKHVIIEKPFAITSDEGNELITLANKKNLKLSVYQNRRFDSDYKTIGEVARCILSNRKIKLFYRDISMNGPMEELALIRKELKAIGININQITRSFNQDKEGTHRAFYVLKVADLYKGVDQ